MAPPKKRKTKTAAPTRKRAGSKKTTARRKTPAAKGIAAPKLALEQHPCRVVSIYGPFGKRTLIDMPTDWVEVIFKDIERPPSPSRVVDATSLDIEKLRDHAPALAESSLAATALALSFELDHPGNSATSKSMCARALNETMDKIRALAPPAEEQDGVDELANARRKRREAAVS